MAKSSRWKDAAAQAQAQAAAVPAAEQPDHPMPVVDAAQVADPAPPPPPDAPGPARVNPFAPRTASTVEGDVAELRATLLELQSTVATLVARTPAPEAPPS